MLKKAVIVGMFVVVAYTLLISVASAAKGKNLEQIPSVPTDFPGNDVNLVKADVFSVKKDSIDN